MPSTYAHARFGADVLKELSKYDKNTFAGSAAEVINQYRELYDIGLHGPDIFFYYEPLHSNEVSALGNELHEMSGREVLGHFAEIAGPREYKARKAYLYGFICHFALDSVCHRYVNQSSAEKKISHVGIESEFERALMEDDGVEPMSHVLTNHIHPSLVNACVISRFFDEVGANEIQKTLKWMVWYHEFLRCPNTVKRGVIFNGMRLIGHGDLTGLLIPDKHDQRCSDSNAELKRLYGCAIPLAVRLIKGFSEGNQILSDPALDRNFESELPH